MFTSGKRVASKRARTDDSQIRSALLASCGVRCSDTMTVPTNNNMSILRGTVA